MAMPPLGDLLALLPDNITGDIGADDMRSIVTSLYDGIVNSGGGSGGSIPIGGLLLWATDSTPSGFADAQGQAVSRTGFPELFAEYGVKYGAGDGTTTFNLPKYNGFFLRVKDNAAGIDPDAGTRTARPDGLTGDNVGTVQLDALKSHQHTIPAQISTFSLGGGQVWNGNGGAARSTALTGGAETRSKNIYVRVLIRTTPAARTLFTSSPITVTAGSKVIPAIAHNLTNFPRNFSAVLNCTVADLGYAFNDYVDMSDIIFDGVVNNGIKLWVSSTQIGGHQENNLKIYHKTTGVLTVINYASWKLLLVAGTLQ